MCLPKSVKRLPNADKPCPVQARLPEAPRRFSIDFCEIFLETMAGQFAFSTKACFVRHLPFTYFGATCNKLAVTSIRRSTEIGLTINVWPCGNYRLQIRNLAQ